MASNGQSRAHNHPDGDPEPGAEDFALTRKLLDVARMHTIPILDHLVPGSKESRIAESAMRFDSVLVLGHPYVDVWQAVKPSVLGLRQWPAVPKSEDIKLGTLHRIGWLPRLLEEASGDVEERGLPVRMLSRKSRPAYLGEASREVLQAATGLGWARILGAVRTYKDLEPSLLGRIEELIDFVTAPAA